MPSSSPSPSPSPLLSIPIHALIESYQTSHGLRHEDYRQYHAYCTRRLSRLRHNGAVKKDLVHSARYVADKKSPRKHAYCARSWSASLSTTPTAATTTTTTLPEESIDSIEPPTVLIPHENMLIVTLLNAERAWSHSLEIKALDDGSTGRSASQGQRLLKAQNEKARSSAGKIRQHSLGRLKRAQRFATQLEEMARATADQRTILETQAYGGWMRGNWSLEVGDWKAALEEYASAMSICRKLSQGSAEDSPENLELRDLFTARANNILKPLLRYCKYELKDADENVALADHHMSELLLGTPEEEAGTATTNNMNKAGNVISFRGHDVDVENKTLCVLLLKMEGLVTDYYSKQSNDDKFLALLTSYDDAIHIVTVDLKKYQSMKSGPAVNAKLFEMESLLGYVKFEKSKLLVGRNEVLVNDLLSREEEEATQSKRLEEIAHLYDALLQDARAVCCLPGQRNLNLETGVPNVGEDDFVLEANANVLRLRALRCFHIARLYSSLDKNTEALALLDQAALLASRASEEIAACEGMDRGDEYLEYIDHGLAKDIVTAQVRAQVQAYVSKQLGGGGGGASSRSLLHRLEEFDAGTNDSLADVPIALIPMPCKPTFFDIAWNYVGEFPLEDIKKHNEQNKPQETSSGLLGWFRS